MPTFTLTAIKLCFALLFAGMLLASCATRQSFQAESLNEQAGWWQCDPKSEREWRCSDGDTVEETTDLVQSDFGEDNTQVESESLVPVQNLPVTDISIKSQDTALPTEPESAQESDENLQKANEPPKELREPALEEVDEISFVANEKKGSWTIQLAAFRSEQEAQRYAVKIENSAIENSRVKGVDWFRVTYGRFIDKIAAQKAARELKQKNTQLNTWIRKID